MSSFRFYTIEEQQKGAVAQKSLSQLILFPAKCFLEKFDRTMDSLFGSRVKKIYIYRISSIAQQNWLNCLINLKMLSIYAIYVERHVEQNHQVHKKRGIRITCGIDVILRHILFVYKVIGPELFHFCRPGLFSLNCFTQV